MTDYDQSDWFDLYWYAILVGLLVVGFVVSELLMRLLCRKEIR
jgi:hypothetical protein